MGTLVYGTTNIEIDFDDRALAHLQIVITSKLRRNESFLFTWTNDSSVGSGRNSVWLHPSIPLFYRFYGSKKPSINREWLELLMNSAHTSNGLLFANEPHSSTHPAGATRP